MIEWIEETIDPPGIEKKNRFAIFKTIGDIMGRVRDDAVKAYNAHFPYLADESKLEEHGKALNIPHLINDKPEEFRNRVTAASFFLMKAGERGFIMDLLKERFGDRFEVVEKFLQLQTKVLDITDEEKQWVFSLLDSLIDPNVSLDVINVILRQAYAEVFCGAIIKGDGLIHLLASENNSNVFAAVFPQIKCCINIFAGEVL